MAVTAIRNTSRDPKTPWYKRQRKRTSVVDALAKCRESFALNLHLWVFAKGMQFVDISRATGIALSQIGKWRHQAQWPQDKALDKLSETLQIPIYYFFLDWDTVFDHGATMFSPQLEAIRNSEIPAHVKAKNYSAAISLLSLMIKQKSAMTKALDPKAPSSKTKKRG